MKTKLQYFWAFDKKLKEKICENKLDKKLIMHLFYFNYSNCM